MPGPDFAKMLEELADSYPEVKEQAMQLKDDMLELMPEEAPVEEDALPELDMADDEEVDLAL